MYPSLSPTRIYQVYPIENKAIGSYNQAVFRDDIEAHLPIYDDNDGARLDRLSRSVQHSIEKYTARDLTPRTRQAYWQSPAMIIRFPVRPVNSLLMVEQYDGHDWVVEEYDYNDGNALGGIKLNHLRPTRITYTSGFSEVPEEFVQAILQEIAYQYKNRNDPDESPATTKYGLSMPTISALATLL